MNKKQILLVEDDRDDETLTLDAFRNAGVLNPIIVARDGFEALVYLFPHDGSARKPCLIMLDLKLPKINGFEVLRRIRSDARTRTIPVVILTTSGEPEDMRMAYEGGANSYVRKPVEFEKFSEAVRSLGMYWILVNESYI
jgi:two-component system response regulator